LKVPFDIVNNRKRDEWILPEQNADWLLSQSQDTKPVGDSRSTQDKQRRSVVIVKQSNRKVKYFHMTVARTTVIKLRFL
jgi:hypothetical protein